MRPFACCQGSGPITLSNSQAEMSSERTACIPAEGAGSLQGSQAKAEPDSLRQRGSSAPKAGSDSAGPTRGANTL